MKNNKFYIHGSIGEEVKSETIISQLNSASGAITVDISSNGGSVHEGTAIYNALIAYKSHVTIQISGWALSIASMIAMAGDTVAMADTGVLMVHKPHMATGGNADNLRKDANTLDVAQKALVNAYTRKTGISASEIDRLLKNETWLTAEEALSLGFIDEIINNVPLRMAASFDLTKFNHIPTWVKNMKSKAAENKESDNKGIQNKQMLEMKAESDRIAGFNQLFRMFKQNPLVKKDSPLYAEFANHHIDAILDKSCTVEMLREKLHNMLGRDMEPSQVFFKDNDQGISDIMNMNNGSKKEIKNFTDAATDVLLIRNGVSIKEPHPASRDLKNMGMAEIARNILRMNNDYNASGYSDAESIIQALHSTSDFPALLANTGGKSLLEGYETAPITCREWTGEHEVPDFKDQTLARLSEAPEMLEVSEGGEYKHGSFGEAADTFKIKKWGRIFSISREALINDDLSAFTRLPHAFGQRAAALESDEVYSLLTSGGNLADGSPLFDASRGNLAASGTTLSVSSLGAARAEMRQQKGLDGKSIIDIQPRYLLVPVELETTAEQLLSSLVDPAGTNDTMNPGWIRSLMLVADPRMTGTAWYLSSAPGQVESIIRAFLQGTQRPDIEEKNGFEIDDFSIKARLEFAAAIVDPKGLYKNPGT